MKFFLDNGAEITIQSVRYENSLCVQKTKEDGTRFLPSEEALFYFKAFPDSSYMLTAYKHNGNWFPENVFHNRPSAGFSCPCCGQSPVWTSRCEAVQAEIGSLLRTLLRHPAIRIRASLRFKPLCV